MTSDEKSLLSHIQIIKFTKIAQLPIPMTPQKDICPPRFFFKKKACLSPLFLPDLAYLNFKYTKKCSIDISSLEPHLEFISDVICAFNGIHCRIPRYPFAHVHTNTIHNFGLLARF